MNPHCLTICAAKRVPSCRTFAFFPIVRHPLLRSAFPPINRTLRPFPAHRPPIPQPSQRKAASTAAPSFLCRASGAVNVLPPNIVASTAACIVLSPRTRKAHPGSSAHRPPMPIQANQKSASTAPPFMRRASSTRAPGAHRHSEKAYISLPAPHASASKTPSRNIL